MFLTSCIRKILLYTRSDNNDRWGTIFTGVRAEKDADNNLIATSMIGKLYSHIKTGQIFLLADAPIKLDGNSVRIGDADPNKVYYPGRIVCDGLAPYFLIDSTYHFYDPCDLIPLTIEVLVMDYTDEESDEHQLITFKDTYSSAGHVLTL